VPGSSARQQAKDLLLSRVLPAYSENSPAVRNQISVVTDRASDLAAGVLLEIAQLATRLDVPPGATRTRQTKFSSTGWPVGLSIHNRIITKKGSSKEVLTCLLSSKVSIGQVEFWVRGVSEDESGLTWLTDQVRCGVPVRRGLVEVTEANRGRILDAAERWLREGLARCT
jgi:hypothetical protein